MSTVDRRLYYKTYNLLLNYTEQEWRTHTKRQRQTNTTGHLWYEIGSQNSESGSKWLSDQTLKPSYTLSNRKSSPSEGGKFSTHCKRPFKASVFTILQNSASTTFLHATNFFPNLVQISTPSSHHFSQNSQLTEGTRPAF